GARREIDVVRQSEDPSPGRSDLFPRAAPGWNPREMTWRGMVLLPGGPASSGCPLAVRKIMRLGLAAALLLLMPRGAAAQQSAARQACGPDINKLCAAVQPGGGRITACVREHFTEFSEACRNALISGATITKACAADSHQRCAGIEPGGG